MGITVVSDDPISGSDLTAGNVKRWVLDVQTASLNKAMNRKFDETPKIMWEE